MAAWTQNDGASVNCNSSLDGAVSGTFVDADRDAGGLSVGDKGATLESEGLYLYCLRRRGKDGTCNVKSIFRRMHYTPNCKIPVIYLWQNK